MSFHVSMAHFFMELNNIPLSGWIQLIFFYLFTYSRTSGSLHSFGSMNKAGVDICVQVFV